MKDKQTLLIKTIDQDYKLFVFPNSKKERVSFKALDMLSNREVNISTMRNVKYFLKKNYKPSSIYQVGGCYNDDKTTFYLESVINEYGAVKINGEKILIPIAQKKPLTKE